VSRRDGGKESSVGAFTALVSTIDLELQNGIVALGVECSSFLPDDPEIGNPRSLTRKADVGLASKRRASQALPWNAGPGASALVTGMTQLYRVFSTIARQEVERIGTDSSMLKSPSPGSLFIWEAFVAGAAKRPERDTDDVGDAINAVHCFFRYVEGTAKEDDKYFMDEQGQVRLNGAADARVDTLNVPELMRRSFEAPAEEAFTGHLIIRPRGVAAGPVYDEFTTTHGPS
jgi:hypothetical protein